ncbi:MAG: hypothetical protein NVS4B3_25600 [Gemmatimonadaceae bacterium]
MNQNDREALITRAAHEKWCTDSTCRECEPVAFRGGLHALRQNGTLVMAMERMDVSAWYSLERWDGAVRLSFDALHDQVEIDRVLSSWLSRLDGHVRIAAVVLFDVIRPGRASDRNAMAWIRLSIAMAIDMEDPPLLESLVYTLGNNIREETGLHDVAKRSRRRYPGLAAAMRTLGIA